MAIDNTADFPSQINVTGSIQAKVIETWREESTPPTCRDLLLPPVTPFSGACTEPHTDAVPYRLSLLQTPLSPH